MRIGFSRHACSIVLSGRKSLWGPGGTREIHAGQAILYPAGSEFVTEDSRDYVSLLIFVTLGFFSQFASVNDLRPTQKDQKGRFMALPISDALLARAQAIAHQVERFGQASARVRSLDAEAILTCLLEEHGSEAFSPMFQSARSPRDLDIADALEREWSSNRSIRQIAAALNMSGPTFYRHVKRIYGISPAEWFQERRMMEAWHMLALGGERPSKVAYDIGFSSHSAFSDAFKRHFGVTPKDAAMVGARH